MNIYICICIYCVVLCIFVYIHTYSSRVFQLLDRKPIGPANTDGTGLRPRSLKGEIKLDNVQFAYPARPDTPVLRGFNLTLSPGKVVALVRIISFICHYFMDIHTPPLYTYTHACHSLQLLIDLPYANHFIMNIIIYGVYIKR